MSDALEPAPLVLSAAADAFASSRVVTTVFETILAAVHDGTLVPGQRISDGDLAAQLGVSRTPIREALQRLREIGIIEASASRFTRIAVVSPQQTIDAMVVWMALYSALLREVVGTAPAEIADAMQLDYDRFVTLLPELNAGKLAEANFDFFAHLTRLSRNPILQKGITSVVHQIRLGGVHLPAFLDVRALAGAQSTLIAAVRSRDVSTAVSAIRMIGQIEVPLTE